MLCMYPAMVAPHRGASCASCASMAPGQRLRRPGASFWAGVGLEAKPNKLDHVAHDVVKTQETLAAMHLLAAADGNGPRASYESVKSGTAERAISFCFFIAVSR